MISKSYPQLIRLLVIISLSYFLASCGDGDGPTPVYDAAPPAAETLTLVWSDEFDVDGAPDVRNWRIEYGFGVNNEWQTYTDDAENLRVENGNLVISAQCSNAVTDPALCNSADKDGTITSARINTNDKVEVKYGSIQARIKMPPGKGTWPAFWMLGADFPEKPWPRAGEIDIVEVHQFFSDIFTSHFTVHWCDDSIPGPVPCEFIPGRQLYEQTIKLDTALSDDYHVYEADWDENRIVGKIDGVAYFTKPIDPDTEEEFLNRFFMILNVAVGGDLGGPPNDSTTWPQEMLVDWVRVYEKNKADVVELVPDDRTAPFPFMRFVNSAEFGGDSVVATIQRTVSEDDEDFDAITPPAVSPLTGNTIVEFDYQSANTFFSGGAFLFKLKDLTHYEKLVFSIDTSTFGRRLLNGGFGSPEASDGDVLCHTDWDCVNGSYTTAADGPNSAPVSHNPEDNQSIKQFVGNDGLTFQVVAATPGTTYQATVWAMNWFGNGTTDPFTQTGFMELSFLDAGGNVIPKSQQYVYVDAVDDGKNVYLPSQDGADVSDWTELTIDAVAPAGTVSAKMLLKHQLDGGSGGSLRWDDASITATITSGGSVVLSPHFDDINIEMQDDRFNGDGTPGKTSLLLSNYTPTEVWGNWRTYEIPLTDFNLTNLDNVALFGFWNPNNAADQLIAGKLYLDNIKFVNVPCTANGTVSFNSDTVAGNSGATQITVTDSCLANKNKKVVVVVDNGTESIGVSVLIDASGDGTAEVNFGPTRDASSTIAIQEGDVLTASYTDANGVTQSDSASISTPPLAVYSETRIENVIAYDGINNVDTVTDEASTAVVALEGSVSLQSDYSVPAGSENGFAFNFPDKTGGLLVNGSFELPDASAGDFGIFPCDGIGSIGAPGWDTFNCNFIVNTATSAPLAHSGNQVLKQFGVDPGAKQSVSVSAGDTVIASAYALNYEADQFNDLAILQLSFFNANPALDQFGNPIPIGGAQVLARPDGSVDYQLEPKPGTAVTDWTQMQVSAVAPPETVRAEVLIIQADVQIGGVIFWDEVSLRIASQALSSNDISYFQTLSFGINSSAAGTLEDIEVRMQDAAANVASVFLSDYTPTPGAVAGWDVYEIPLANFVGLDQTDIRGLGFYNASSTVSAPPSGSVTYFPATLYFDDVYFTVGDVLTGVLVNSPIEGVTFSTATQSGTTNALGEFQYFQGEMITFSIGGIDLGTVPGAPVVTPVELTGSVNATDQAATNQLVFLQSIDVDQDHANGITIDAATQAAAASQTLDFTLDSATFTTAVTAVVDAIAPIKVVVSETDAVNNYYTTFPPTASGATTTISAVPATVDADGVSLSTITVQAKDSSGNNIIVSAGTVTLSSASGTAVISPVTDNDNGTYTATVTNAVAEAVTITGTIAGNAITDDASVIFIGAVSGATTTIDVTTPVEANGTATGTITVQAKDGSGNNIITSAGTVTLTTVSGTAVISPVTDNNDGTYTATITNTVVEDVIITGTIAGIAITDDATVSFIIGAADGTTTTIVATPASAAVNNGSNTSTISTITVQAKDGSGNNLTASGGTVTLSTVSLTAVISGINDNNDGTYTATVTDTATETVTITGTIAGNAITDDATVIFAPSVAVYSETNRDTELIPSEPAFGDLACDAIVIDDNVPSSTYPSYEGSLSSSTDLPATVTTCVGVVVNFGDPGNTLVPYSQDFDGLDAGDPEALGTVSGELFLAFADVWDGDVGTGAFLYSYGPFSAPNGGAGFSAIAAGEGQLDPVTDQYLNIYSDYNNADHANGFNINSSVFREQTIASVGGIWIFSGDFKAPSSCGIAQDPSCGPDGLPGTGDDFVIPNNSTARAFIKTLDPNSGFATTNDIGFDTTSADPNNWGSFSLEIPLADPALAGQILQFGFNTIATNYNDSGVFYDNLNFAVRTSVDISGYATLKFAYDRSGATPALADLELRMEDTNGATASVYLSNYTPTPANIVGADWQVYDIPVTDFTGIDNTIMKTLGFYNPSSTVSDPAQAGTVTPVTGTLRSDDIHFIEQP